MALTAEELYEAIQGKKEGGKPKAAEVITPESLYSAIQNLPASANDGNLPVAAQLYNQFQTAKRNLGAGIVSLADTTLGGLVPAVAGPVTYAGARALQQSPQQAAELEQRVVSATQNPFGRMLGVTEAPGYKQEASRRLMEFIGENVSKGADWISKQTGLPASDVQNMIGTLTVAAPGVVKTAAKPLVQAAQPAIQTAKQWASELGPAQQLQEQFQAKGGMRSGGAAAAMPNDVLAANIQSAVTNVSPDLQKYVASQNPRAINLPALETRALEERHGVNLTTGQRSGDVGTYSSEWNRRGETPELQMHFQDQPKQFRLAFENSLRRNAPDIFDLEPSSLGQIQINALAAKDAVRMAEINKAYKALEDANGGQFPIDVGTLDKNIHSELSKQLKTSHLSSAISSDLKDFYKNPTFEGFEALRTNLANEIRSSSNGNARAAAYIVRDQLENLPIFGEKGGSPQAIQLKELADNARKLYRDRQQIIKSNPAYRAAVKDYGSLEEAAAQGESLNAEKFHQKFVTGATPESIRRMKAELADSPEALQAITAGEMQQIMRKAGLHVDNPDLNVKTLTNYIHDNKAKLRESLSPEAMQDLMELSSLASRVGMPKAGTFNYSNTWSSQVADMAKQGLATAAETKLASMTGGASVPVVSLGRQLMQKMSKEQFAKEALNPYGGLTKEK